MRHHLYNIANYLETLGYFKYASKMDKIAEMLPELGKHDVEQAYRLLGFDIGNRDNLTEDEVKKTARQKIMDAHPDRATEDKKVEANHNTRILIDAMKLALADISKYKMTGSGLGQGVDGGTVSSDFSKWQASAENLDEMIKQMADELKKTRTMYMRVKHHEGDESGFGEDDDVVKRYRQRIEDKKKSFEEKQIVWLVVPVPRAYDPYGYRSNEKTFQYVRMKIDLATNTILDLDRIDWGRNTIGKNEVRSYKDKYVGTVYDNNDVLEKSKQDSIKQEEFEINKRKQKLLSHEKVEGIGGGSSASLNETGFYNMMLEEIPKIDNVANIVNIGITSGALRKLERGEHKGELTVEDVGVKALFTSNNALYDFSAAVFSYLATMVPGSSYNSNSNRHAEYIVKKILLNKLGVSSVEDFIKQYYGEDWEKYDYKTDWDQHNYKEIIKSNPEKYAAALDVKKRMDSLTSLVELRIKEYAHAIAQVYKTANMSKYYNPDDFTRSSGKGWTAQFFNDLTDYRKESYDRMKEKSQEALNMGSSLFDVDKYSKHIEENKSDVESRLQDFYKEREEARNAKSVEKASELLDEVKKLKESEQYSGVNYVEIPKGSRSLDVDAFNRMFKYYLKKIMDLPVWDPEMVSATKKRVTILEDIKEKLTQQYGELDKWHRDNIARDISFISDIDIKYAFRDEKDLPDAKEFWQPLYTVIRELIKSIHAFFKREPIVLGEQPVVEKKPVVETSVPKTETTTSPKSGGSKIKFIEKLSKYKRIYYEAMGDLSGITDLLNKYGWEKKPNLIFKDFDLLKKALEERGVAYEVVK